jgi:hypothetical protein
MPRQRNAPGTNKPVGLRQALQGVYHLLTHMSPHRCMVCHWVSEEAWPYYIVAAIGLFDAGLICSAMGR